MAKNNELLAALSNTEALTQADATIRNKALDDLLAADPADATAFRLAIKSNEVFWQAQSAALMAPKMNVGRGYLAPTPVEGYFTSDDFLDPNNLDSFTKIRQKAAEQRVGLGLKAASDQVLLDILKNNREACRAYLAEKFPDLTHANGWVATPPVIAPPAPAPGAPPAPPAPPAIPENTSRTVLTDPAIDSLRKDAIDLLISKSITKSKDKTLLTNMLTAGDTQALRAAATALGIQPAVKDSLEYPLRANVRAEIEARVLKLDQIQAEAQFPDQVKEYSHDQILAFKTVLENDNIAAFKANLAEPYNKLEGNELIKAKNLVGARYLEVLLADSKEIVLPAINAANEADLRAALKNLPSIGNHAYIDTAVNSESIDQIRHALVESFIKNQPDAAEANLKELYKAEPLIPFKAKFAPFGITNTAWMNDHDMGDIKKWARTRAFEIMVNKTSRFGNEAHPELINAFNNLTVEKQNELLDNPENLRILLNAVKLNQTQHHFGRISQAAALIAGENTVLEQFKGIHNAKIANILANIKPPITLTTAQIDAINQAFVTPAAPRAYKAITLNNHAEYKALIDLVKSQSGPVNEANFYKAFGLNAAGSAIENIAIRNDISAQHINNQHLYAEYYAAGTTPGNKKVLDVFLSSSKAAPLTSADKNAVVDSIKTGNEPATAALKELKSKFKFDLNPLVQDLAFERIKENMTNNAVLTVEGAITDMRASLTALTTQHESLKVNAKKLEQLATTEDLHLMNPAFQGKARAESVEMHNNFKELATDCDLIVDQLRRQQVALKGYKKSLPQNIGELRVPGAPETNASDDEKARREEIRLSINKLNEDLNSELKEVEEDLEFYENIQIKLHGDKDNKKLGILEVIENAALGKKSFIYKTDGFSSYIKGKEAERIPAPDESIATVEAGVSGEELPFLLGESLSKGQVRVYDFKQKSIAAPANEFKGQFTEERSVSNTQVPNGTFQVKEFPKEPQLAPRQGGLSAEQKKECEQAKVAFALGMAVQTLASMDGKPTKDNQVRLRGNDAETLKYLYAALITLGVDKNAIKVRSKVFDPDAEKGILWGFKGESYVESVFKKEVNDVAVHGASVKQSQEDLKQLHDLKEDKSGVRKDLGKNAADATRLFKEKSKEARDAAEKTFKEEGPVPGSPKVR